MSAGLVCRWTISIDDDNDGDLVRDVNKYHIDHVERTDHPMVTRAKHRMHTSADISADSAIQLTKLYN